MNRGSSEESVILSQQFEAHLPKPAYYFPIEQGRYEVTPGLRPLGCDFGNGSADAQLFQIDNQFSEYRNNKLECRRERLRKYYCAHDFREDVAAEILDVLIWRLTTEHSKWFRYENRQLHCRLTGEILNFDASYRLIATCSSAAPPIPSYIDAFDAVVSQAPEDIAVVCRGANGSNWLAAIHGCSSSHWSPEEKIGRDFAAIHLPVPGIDRINRASQPLVAAMIDKGPFVRFVWSFATDRRLNHHRQPPPGIDPKAWRGRRFDPTAPDAHFYIRVERQVMLGVQEVDAAIFSIRTYFLDSRTICENQHQRSQLRHAMLSMSDGSRAYKGLEESFEAVLHSLHD